jgi:hypothetical protein
MKSPCRLPIAYDLAGNFETREAFEQEAQRFLELDQRDRPSEAQVAPRTKVEDRPRTFARNPEFIGRLEHRRIVVAGDDRSEQPSPLDHRNADQLFGRVRAHSCTASGTRPGLQRKKSH